MSLFKVLSTLDLEYAFHAVQALRGIAHVKQIEIDRQALLNQIAEYDAWMCHASIQGDREVLDKAVRLRVIATPSTGTDHLDVKYMRERGIDLLALTTEYELLDTFTATAEASWGLLLACLRRIPAGLDAVRRGEWKRADLCTSWQLSTKTLGVIGVGRLGKMVVEYGKAFRMRVLGCDIKPVNITGMQQVDFDTLIRESDVISLHVHLTDDTRGMLSKEAFRRMKDGVVIVNTSRGAIIDERALLEALESGKVFAAGLDVIEGEWMEDITQHPLVQYAQTHDNLVITPHMASATIESRRDAVIYTGKKLAEYLSELRERQSRATSETAD